MDLEFSGEIFYWRGPAPFFFVSIPEDQSSDIKAISRTATYGWGVIPVTVQIGATVWATSLFPKGNLYLVPLKVSVRKAEALEEGDDVTLRLTIKF
jgi:hypothetical protein